MSWSVWLGAHSTQGQLPVLQDFLYDDLIPGFANLSKQLILYLICTKVSLSNLRCVHMTHPRLDSELPRAWPEPSLLLQSPEGRTGGPPLAPGDWSLRVGFRFSIGHRSSPAERMSDEEDGT